MGSSKELFAQAETTTLYVAVPISTISIFDFVTSNRSCVASLSSKRDLNREKSTFTLFRSILTRTTRQMTSQWFMISEATTTEFGKTEGVAKTIT